MAEGTYREEDKWFFDPMHQDDGVIDIRKPKPTNEFGDLIEVGDPEHGGVFAGAIKDKEFAELLARTQEDFSKRGESGKARETLDKRWPEARLRLMGQKLELERMLRVVDSRMNNPKNEQFMKPGVDYEIGLGRAGQDMVEYYDRYLDMLKEGRERGLDITTTSAKDLWNQLELARARQYATYFGVDTEGKTARQLYQEASPIRTARALKEAKELGIDDDQWPYFNGKGSLRDLGALEEEIQIRKAAKQEASKQPK